MCANRDELDRATVLVTDFADLQTFLPNQSGLLMGELMRGSLNNVCCTKIIQAEFAKYFKLSENGLVVLTRKASEIKKDEYFQSDAIVGTYSFQNNNKVVIFARKLNMDTGRITRMVTREVNYSCSGRSVDGYTVK
ncbi:MAG: FlgO family outer membrane protein [Desulfuromonadaceae bacterium]|nr:FlgO family outer membrane protein [Desulfuromonadaceae bacterium]